MDLEIIICTYNNAPLLDQTLEAIARQQVKTARWSVLVVDNNCTDGTAAVVEKHRQSQRIPNLRKVTEMRQGLVYARLCGITHTSATWIAFVDDDCLLQENWVEQAAQFAHTHPHCGAFGGKVVLDWETPPPAVLKQHERAFAACDRGHQSQQLSRQDSHIPGAGLVLQRTALLKSEWVNHQWLIGRSGNQLTAGDDSEIVLRILNAGYELWYNSNCLLYHHIAQKRISEAYLIRLVFGFGLSAPLIAYLRWNTSYSSWLSLSILRLLKSMAQAMLKFILALLHLHSFADARVEWSWAQGQLQGLFTLLRSNGSRDWRRLH